MHSLRRPQVSDDRGGSMESEPKSYNECTEGDRSDYELKVMQRKRDRMTKVWLQKRRTTPKAWRK